LKKEILSDDFKKRKIFWKNIAENFLWKMFHPTSLVTAVLRDVLLTLQSGGPTCCVPTITSSFVIAVFSTMT
jgi:hypothetical protein